MVKTKSDVGIVFARSLIELRYHLRLALQQQIKRSGVTFSFQMAEILLCLGESDGISQQEIAKYTFKDKASITRLIDKLIQLQMIRRLQAENDHRTKHIFLTENGKATYLKLYTMVANVCNQVTDNLSKDDLRQGVVMMHKLTLNAISAPGTFDTGS